MNSRKSFGSGLTTGCSGPSAARPAAEPEALTGIDHRALGMYQALLFIHVASAFLYFLLHGGVASVAFVLGRQSRREAGEALESILDYVNPAAPLSLAVTVLSGIILGIMGRWWRWGWIWTSLILLALIWFAMSRLGNRYFDEQFQRIYESEVQPNTGQESGTQAYQPSKLSGVLQGNPAAFLTAIGVAGMFAILWLMMSKPF